MNFYLFMLIVPIRFLNSYPNEQSQYVLYGNSTKKDFLHKSYISTTKELPRALFMRRKRDDYGNDLVEVEPYVPEDYDTAAFPTTTTSSIYEAVSVGFHGLDIVEKKPHPGSCFTWAGSHFKTFDGEIFSFTSSCAHTLVQDQIDNTFSIIIQNSEGCSNNFVNCFTIIKIYVQDKEYILTHSDDGIPIFESDKRILPIPGRIPGIRTQISAHYIIILLDSVGAKLKWDGEQLVQVEVKESLWNKTSGLCGKIDGDASNDMFTKENNKAGRIAALARSWTAKMLGKRCEEIPPDKHVCHGNKDQEARMFCNQLFSDKQFALCKEVIDIRKLLDACVWDYCSCKADLKECACETLNVYVRECAHKGVTALTRWRDNHTCSIQCDGGKVYMPCAPAEGQTLCGGASEKLDENAECEEGCYCPEGTFFHNYKCILKENCPCIHRGKEYPPGSTIPKECNTCTCSNNKWVCTQLICGTRCSVIGDPHYTTFDGKHYDFMGKCTYTLVEHKNFTIEVENVPCGSVTQGLNVDNLASCPKTVIVKIEGQIIKVRQGREVTINGQEVPTIPFSILGASIRVASSMFLLVELTNGAEVWWDGVTRVHVNVPPSFIGQTKGLCGTFNNNQKDDFLTPEGDIEQSVIPFANKWKTTEICDNILDKVYSHPCDINMQNKAPAEEHCKIIKSKLFTDCNTDIDPESFYQDCLYDLCSCDSKLSKCLCPMVAAYAEECARTGIQIDWRNEVADCGVHCPSGQMYHICGNSCTRSCSDIGMLTDCQQQCVEGCNCPKGETLNKNGDCIPIGQCECQHDGLEFPAGYKEIRSVSQESKLCTCINAQWSCKPATQEDITKYPNSTNLKTVCNDDANEEFTTCEPVEPITCKNMHSPELVTTAVCHSGCQCKEGYVRDGFSKTCVKPSQCPCHHGGQSYRENSAIQGDCNTCTCKHGKWQCTSNFCPGECSAWGDSHYKTFDGRLYDYQGQCDYILAKGTLGNENAFDVSIQNVPCSTLGVSCSKSISIRVGTAPNQETIILTREEDIPEHATLTQLIVRQTSHFVIVDAPELKFSVLWDKGTRVYVKLDTFWKNQVKGLCGNYNGNQLDDFQTPYGGITEVSPQLFGDSWRMQPYCTKAFDITNTCEKRPDRKVWALKKCGILKSSVFASCHSEVPFEIYLERCIFDTCACDQGEDCACLCTALAAYAQECNNKGIPVKWRTPELCPMQCDERCSHYNPCISTCPIETCDNMLVHSQLKKMCEQDTCIEGCQGKTCPQNFVYLNASMLECVPRNACQLFCIEIDGVKYAEGDIIEEDACHTCHCSRGKKLCQGEPCPEPTEYAHEAVQCQPGWTEWINQNKFSINKTGEHEKYGDLEPLPASLTMNGLGKIHCDAQNMIDIECRTVKTHLPPKETGLNVECSLEHGLICRLSGNENTCVDFEIRVKCECKEVSEATETPPLRFCDVSKPYHEHPRNCHFYYKCVLGNNGTMLKEMACYAEMMYNPLTYECDFPDDVLQIKPKCSKKSGLQKKPKHCRGDEELNDCGVQCNRMCLHYSHEMKQQGHCRKGNSCEEGCIPSKKNHSCPPGMYWANNLSCIAKRDCMCVSRNGTIVKPGRTFNESQCEVCQCIDNYYTCDNSTCYTTPIGITTTTQPPLCDVTKPSKEHEASCYLYYKCEYGEYGSELVEKECPAEMMYNPRISECDSPNIVIQIKPQCSEEFAISEIRPATCPDNEELLSCAIQCRRLCMYYSELIKQKGHCHHGLYCERGCVSNKIIHRACPPGMYWASNLTCIPKEDCKCISHNGTPVEPGEVIKESDCEICQCINNNYNCDNSTCLTTPSFTTPTSIQPTTALCDVTQPSREHAGSCYLYYECEYGENGLELMEKDCPAEMMFNPKTLACDFSNEVIKIKPVCLKEPCPPGEQLQNCFLPCHQFCQHYLHQMQKDGHCNNGQSCEKGCISTKKKQHTCPPGMYFANNHSCIPKKGCMCVSHNGTVVMPGTTFKESNCEICNCINNKYTCDKSACVTTLELPALSTVTTEAPPILITLSTVTPPAECDSDNYINLVDGDIPLADEAFTASSILSNKFAPKSARLHNEGGNWAPQISNEKQYLEINLSTQEPIFGVIIKGSPLHDDYVTSYTILYSPDGYSFSYITDYKRQPKIFRGSFDGNTESKIMFDNPIEAQIIRIQPKTWHNTISLRVELIGCMQMLSTSEPIVTTVPTSPYCSDPMGLDNGMMSDQQVTVSSELKPIYLKDELKISSKNAWKPNMNSPLEWIQFNLLELRNISGFITRGGADGWVTAFNVRYSHNGNDWNPILDNTGHELSFLGNVDGNEPHVINFHLPIRAKLLKIIPIKWHQNIQLRIELLGCFIPYPAMKVTTTTVLPPTYCNYCPGVFISNLDLNNCKCKENLWWDGENCVLRTQCPCIVGHISYDVGAVFEMEDCTECVCKLGGVSHCTPKICDTKCDKESRRVVTSTCGCICQPCSDGTRLCPTSNICINDTDWCNGVQDCSDDETGCIAISKTTIPTTTTEQIEELKMECPKPQCPHGYRVVIKKKSKLETTKSSFNTMFSTNIKTNHRKGGAKGVKEDYTIEDIKPSKSIHEKVHEEIQCAEFECRAAVAPPPYPGSTRPTCPEVVCPLGYNLEVYDTNLNADACPSYECTPAPPIDVVCNITGRTFNSFDLTDYKYDICNHILAREFEYKQWEISIKKNCTTTCSRNLIIHHDNHMFVLHSDFSIEYDHFKYTIDHTKKIGSHLHFFEINQLGDTLVFVSNKYGFWVTWDKQENAKIGMTTKLVEMVDGLCGYFNGNPKDDKRKPNGAIAKTTAEFGDSWVVPGEPSNCEAKVCPVHIQNKAWEMCNLVKQKAFHSCAQAVNIDGFVSRCLETTCTCIEAAENDMEAQEKCRCLALQSFVVDCLSANSELEVIDWRTNNDCPVSCEAPLVHHDCYRRRCEPSCDTLSPQDVSSSCPKLSHVCFPGCYCPAGYVRKGKSCILPTSCGDCECNVLPHLEYFTYDESNFTVNGPCVYVMSRDVLDQNNKEHKFQVLITNSDCEDKINQICVEKVTILYNGHIIDIVRDSHNSKLKLIADSLKIYDFNKIEDWVNVIEDPVHHLRILLTKIQVLVSVYYPSLGVSIKVPSLKYGGKLEGLCGDCNTHKDDDLKMPKGAVTSDTNEFGLSWLYEGVPGGQNEEQCSNQEEQVCEELATPNPCIQLENSEIYGQCHPVLSPSLFIEWCKRDTCNGDPKQACSAIAAYSHECGHLGFCIDWHTQLCPQKTCPTSQKYIPCAPKCIRTCDTGKVTENCNNPPIEGCFCSKGEIYLNNTCVLEERCKACDDGHYSGDTWQKDPCTKCSCEERNIRCYTQSCPVSKVICEDGFTVKKISTSDECCDRYTCVQAPSNISCGPTQELECSIGQIMKLIKKADNCQQYVCECIPIKDCEPPRLKSSSLKPGFVETIDATGCCPVAVTKCMVEFCPTPPSCPKFHALKEEPASNGECCSTFTCIAPKGSCIINLEYMVDEIGGERARNDSEKEEALKEINEKWQDGPCRQCQCVVSPTGDNYKVCTVTECTVLAESTDHEDYILESKPVVGQCCAAIKKVGCKNNGLLYDVGKTWQQYGDPCTTFECVEDTQGIQKVIRVVSCNTKCDLGLEYQAPSLYSNECCGFCKPTGCVSDGKFHKIGESWKSLDFCTNYYCSYTNGSIQIESMMVNCPELLKDLLIDYEVKTSTNEGECCKTQTIVGCKVGNIKYQVGEAWPSPDGNKCKTITCTENKSGEIIKEESMLTCDTNCPMGSTYNESDSKCCGDCIKVACVADNQLRYPGDNWKSADGCTNYFCDDTNNQFTIVSQQESCPNTEGCLPENIYFNGCCTYCNLTSESQGTCGTQAINPSDTIGLVSIRHHLYGECTNTEPLQGFTECIGNCKSFTKFNSLSGQHESKCSCCQVSNYKAFQAVLQCSNGYTYKKDIAIPSKCTCEACVSEKLKESNAEAPRIERRYVKIG